MLSLDFEVLIADRAEDAGQRTAWLRQWLKRRLHTKGGCGTVPPGGGCGGGYGGDGDGGDGYGGGCGGYGDDGDDGGGYGGDGDGYGDGYGDGGGN